MASVLKAIARTFAVALLSSAVVPVTVLVVILGSFIFLPLPASLPAPRQIEAGQISHVYDENGDEIGQFREFEQNIPVKQTDIPLHLKQAVVASEDKNFYSHGGVDVRGTARALYTDLRGGEITQGGSTITQQYVKNAYVGKERTVVRKVREAIIASQLDRQEKKDDILFKYLSTIYLGGGAYGVGAASESYFRKPVKDLTVAEAALLAGIIPAPSRYEPRANPTLAEGRREVVLGKMLAQHYVTQDQYNEAMAHRVKVLGVGEKPPPATTVVYPPQAPASKYPYFLDYVGKYLKAKYGPEKVDRGGLRIQTTLDPRIQDAAEAAVAGAVAGVKPITVHDPGSKDPKKTITTPFEGALSAVEPQTGFVKALVGGRDFNQSNVNLALAGCPDPNDKQWKGSVEVDASCWPLDAQGKYVEGGGTGRQPGSSFKPFVLATAFSKGVPPTKVYPAPNVYHIPRCTGAGCTISNYEGESFGSSDLRHAMWHSINTVYAQLIRDVGCKDTAEMAKRLGLTTAFYSPRFHTCSGAYALGEIDTSPLDMASAYSSFAARGLHQEPTPIVRVEDATGKVLEDNRKREPARVLDEVVADNVTDVLRGVIAGGTGTRANIGRPAAGKTGTAEEGHDAWFVGYTPTLSAAVWVGYRDLPLPMRGIKGCGQMTGGCLPAPTWHNFMQAALKDVPVTDFNQPAPIKTISDALNKIARTGIDPGTARRPAGTTNGGPYEVGPPPPVATPPETSTTIPGDTSGGGGGGGTPSPSPTSSTTTTTTSILPRRP